jgi:predicted GIY-YIG superfamily endonuclease
MLMAYPDKDDDTSREVTVYVLQLENGKYYVGIKARNVGQRFDEHADGHKSAYWTKIHKPIHVIYTEKANSYKAAHIIENKLTRDLMKEHGLNNVRGGYLRDVDRYIKRFGYILNYETWAFMTVVIFLLLTMIYIVIDRYWLNVCVSIFK